MAYRKGITLMLSTIATQVDITGAVQAEESLKTVCVGTTTSHVPTAIKRPATCPECGNDDYPTFKSARVVGKNEFIVVEKDEIASAKGAAVGTSQKIIQLTAHPLEDVRRLTVQGGSTYYLTPSHAALAPLYHLIVNGVQGNPDVALLGIWTPVSRPGLYEVRTFGESTLILSSLEWAEKVSIKEEAPLPLPEANVEQAKALVAGMVKPFAPDTYVDQHAAHIEAVMATKAAEFGVLAESTRTKGAAPAPTGTIDLTSLLNDALAAAS